MTNPINDIQTLLATTLKMVNVNKGLWSFLRCDKLKKKVCGSGGFLICQTYLKCLSKEYIN